MIKSTDDGSAKGISSNTTYKSNSLYKHSVTSNPVSLDEQNVVSDQELSDELLKNKEYKHLKTVSSYQKQKMQSFTDNYKEFLTDCLKASNTKEFFCGWGAALINITITFPINKIIFRQMLHNVKVGGAFEQIRSEGFLFLYRGVLPPLMQKSVSTSLMFGMYENCRKPLVACEIPPLIGNATAAMLAGNFEAILTPFERVQTLMQDSGYHKEFKNTSHAFKIILMDYGFKEFYRGLVPILLRNGPSNIMFFGLRDLFNENIPDSKLWYLRIAKQFMIGACIGSFVSSIFYPCNVIKVHLQSQLGGRYIGVLEATKEVFLERNKSVRSFYRGVYMNCTRSFVSWGVINVSYEAIRKMVYN